MERVTGIEPALSAWEADVLPLNYTRERTTEASRTASARRSGETRAAAEDRAGGARGADDAGSHGSGRSGGGDADGVATGSTEGAVVGH